MIVIPLLILEYTIQQGHYQQGHYQVYPTDFAPTGKTIPSHLIAFIRATAAKHAVPGMSANSFSPSLSDDIHSEYLSHQMPAVRPSHSFNW